MGIRVPTPLAIVTALAMGPNVLAGVENPSLTEPNPPSSRQEALTPSANTDERSHEVSLLVGLMPSDHFVKSYTLTANYTLHLAENWDWEAIHVTKTFNADTELAKELRRFHLPADADGNWDFPEIVFIVGSNIHFNAAYNGGILFGAERLRLEVRLHTGPLLLTRKNAAASFNLGSDAGAGVRLGLGNSFSAIVDTGAVLYFPKRLPLDIKHAFYVRMGAGFVF